MGWLGRAHGGFGATRGPARGGGLAVVAAALAASLAAGCARDLRLRPSDAATDGVAADDALDATGPDTLELDAVAPDAPAAEVVAPDVLGPDAPPPDVTAITTLFVDRTDRMELACVGTCLAGMVGRADCNADGRRPNAGTLLQQVDGRTREELGPDGALRTRFSIAQWTYCRRVNPDGELDELAPQPNPTPGLSPSPVAGNMPGCELDEVVVGVRAVLGPHPTQGTQVLGLGFLCARVRDWLVDGARPVARPMLGLAMPAAATEERLAESVCPTGRAVYSMRVVQTSLPVTAMYGLGLDCALLRR